MQNNKNHFKSYKSGKTWATSLITISVILGTQIAPMLINTSYQVHGAQVTKAEKEKEEKLKIHNEKIDQIVEKAKELGIDIDVENKKETVNPSQEKDTINRYNKDIDEQVTELDKQIEDYKNKKNEFDTADSEFPKETEDNKNGLNTEGGITNKDGIKIKMEGTRDNPRDSKVTAIFPSDMSPEESSHHKLKDGTEIRWNDNTEIKDVDGENRGFNDGLEMVHGGSIRLTNVGTLSDGTNVNVRLFNKEGNDSFTVSPKEPGLDDGNKVGKIIVDSLDNANIGFQLLDDQGNPLEIVLPFFFSDIDEPIKNYVQNVDIQNVQTNGLAVVDEKLKVENGYTLVREGGEFDNHDSNRYSAMTMFYGSEGSIRVFNSGSTKSSGYGEFDNRMITAMFGNSPTIKVLTPPIIPDLKAVKHELEIASPDALNPIKVVTDENGNDTNGKEVKPGDKGMFGLNINTSQYNLDNKPLDLEWNDQLPKEVDYLDASVIAFDDGSRDKGNSNPEDENENNDNNSSDESNKEENDKSNTKSENQNDDVDKDKEHNSEDESSTEENNNSENYNKDEDLSKYHFDGKFGKPVKDVTEWFDIKNDVEGFTSKVKQEVLDNPEFYKYTSYTVVINHQIKNDVKPETKITNTFTAWDGIGDKITSNQVEEVTPKAEEPIDTGIKIKSNLTPLIATVSGTILLVVGYIDHKKKIFKKLINKLKK